MILIVLEINLYIFLNKAQMNVFKNKEDFSNQPLQLFLFQDLVAMISGRIPPQVEKAIKKQLQLYSSNTTSVLSQFPSQQVSTAVLYVAVILQ